MTDTKISGKNTDQQWDTKIEYILACVSYGVGLGNLWRFPYLVYSQKGLTFLIPYFICLFLIGIPFAVLEGALGQFSGFGSIKLFKIAPMFEGIGWGQVLLCFYCCVYYNIICAYNLYHREVKKGRHFLNQNERIS